MRRDRVLISTHDLSRARSLKASFRKLGRPVELVTVDEELSLESNAGLLVLSGGSGEPGHLDRQAHGELSIPVFAIVSEPARASGREAATTTTGLQAVKDRNPALDEVFSDDTEDSDVALVGDRRMQMLRLQEEAGIIGSTESIQEALEHVVRFGPVEATVLLTGESGTGKELFARALHRLSPRRMKPFIAVNVAALSESLLESELFGHEKGAFTGAVDRRKGLFELAQTGTIFLDEIGEISPASQTNLLRVLEQREFRRVGGERMVSVDVRIVAATNQELLKRVAEGDFRRDLFYRLNVLSIRLPPLRERRPDIPSLVESFVAESADRHGLVPPEISLEAMQTLVSHSWPGNVRELKNLVESMVILAPRAPRRAILPKDLPYEVRRGGTLGGGVALVPTGAGPKRGDVKAGPELEVILRSLVEMRADLENLKGEVELLKGSRPDWEQAPLVGHISSSSPALDGELVEAVDVGESADTDRPGNRDSTAPRIGAPGTGRVEEDPDSSDIEHRPSGDRSALFEPGMTMEAMEREAIKTTLKATDGNRREAAKILGIGERTLYRKLGKYGLS